MAGAGGDEAKGGHGFDFPACGCKRGVRGEEREERRGKERRGEGIQRLQRGDERKKERGAGRVSTSVTRAFRSVSQAVEEEPDGPSDRVVVVKFVRCYEDESESWQQQDMRERNMCAPAEGRYSRRNREDQQSEGEVKLSASGQQLSEEQHRASFRMCMSPEGARKATATITIAPSTHGATKPTTMMPRDSSGSSSEVDIAKQACLNSQSIYNLKGKKIILMYLIGGSD
eukprot:754085-Hanusia_phi.AAC.5